MARTQKRNTQPKIQDLFPDVIFDKIIPAPDHPFFNYKGFNPERILLQPGHVRYPGHRAFSTSVVLDRDFAITVRDKARLYADIFRPGDSDSVPVPVILPWSPYGKIGTGPQNYDFMAPFRAGIPRDRTSGYEKFEAPDPAQWCSRCSRGATGRLPWRGIPGWPSRRSISRR